MRRTKFIVDFRNKLASMAMDCDCATAIEDAKMTINERHDLQKKLFQIVNWVDKRIIVK